MVKIVRLWVPTRQVAADGAKQRDFSPNTGYFEESIERKNPSSTKADAGFCKWSKLKRPEARILKKIMNYQ